MASARTNAEELGAPRRSEDQFTKRPPPNPVALDFDESSSTKRTSTSPTSARPAPTPTSSSSKGFFGSTWSAVMKVSGQNGNSQDRSSPISPPSPKQLRKPDIELAPPPMRFQNISSNAPTTGGISGQYPREFYPTRPGPTLDDRHGENNGSTGNSTDLYVRSENSVSANRFKPKPPPGSRRGHDDAGNSMWDVETSQPAKGRLWINVIEARNLLVRSQHAKPYCVVEFEKNEFVTKEAVTMSATADNVEGLCATWKHEATFDVARMDGELTITLWDRAGSVQGEGEAFLGMMKIRPPRINAKVHDNWFRLLPRQWKEKVKGDLRIQLMYKTVEGKPLSAADFELLKVVGKGSFGKVLQVRKKDTGRIYAMKVLIKKDIVERQEVQHTLSERNVLIQATSPFLVGLKFSFQTTEKLYLVLDYMNGGELFYHLQRETAFSEERAKFYTCELILALQHLHKFNIVYRDLKPENILLDSNGHIALTDFGLCKENLSFDETTNTFCGTAEYLAPEVLMGHGYGKGVDWWSLGILFYEMTTGLPPFYSENVNLMYKKILHNQLVFPSGFSPDAQSLVRGLLDRDPKRRLGSGPTDADEIRSHPYFENVDWVKLMKRQVKPPYKPQVESETDTSNFDPVFTETLPVDSLPRNSAPLSETIQQNFKGFTYTREDTSHLNGSMSSLKINVISNN